MNNSKLIDNNIMHTPENESSMHTDDDDYSVNSDIADELHFVMPMEYAGSRFDQALSKLLPEYSRSRLQEWIQEGLAQLDGKTVTNKHKVWGGETVLVTPQIHPSEHTFEPEDIPLDVIYEDDAIIVINKPVGLVTHPGSGNWTGTLLNGLLFHYPELNDVPRAGIVHRLDKDTSGLLVVAKTLVAQTHLVRQLQAHTVKREYLALVWGELKQDATIDAPIGRHLTQRTKMAVVSNGKRAVTRYSVEASYPSCTLLRCRLETGRTHQIRVHLSNQKNPLIGDSLYIKGAQSCIPELRDLLNHFPRQALHATQLGLIHPITEQHLEWEVEMPDDMTDLIGTLHEMFGYEGGDEDDYDDFDDEDDDHDVEIIYA